MPSVRPSRYADVGELASSLRAADVEELRAIGISPDHALLTGLLSSAQCYSGVDDSGVVVCMFGVVDNKEGVTGTIWLLGSDMIPKITLSFLRETKKYLAIFQDQYPLLANVVDSRNRVHCNWLKWCGFKAIREVPINGIPFYEFVRIK